MQVTETSAEGLKRQYRVVVPAQNCESQLALRLQELGRAVRVPGFRPGKVPMSLLKQRYGKAAMGEIVERVVSDSSSQVIAERGLRPAGQPKIEIVSLPDGADLEFNVALELMPDIAPMDFSELKLERLAVEVPDAEVDEAVRRLADKQRKSEPIATPRPAKKGDILVIDFIGRVDGVEFPGGAASEQYLELGSGWMIPGFEDQLEGARPGDHVTVNVIFPADYSKQELAGKAAEFAVDVREIREPVAVPVDDELAKAHGLADLAALRASVREHMHGEYSSVARGRLKRQLLDALAAGHDFALPADLVEAEFAVIWERIETARAAGGLDPEDTDKSDEQLRTEYGEIAGRRVKLGLLLSDVGRLNNIEVTTEEVNRAVMAEAQRHPGRERQVVDFYRKTPEALVQLRAPVYEDKVIDFILELAQVSERKVTPEELVALEQAGAAGEPAADDTEKSSKKPATKKSGAGKKAAAKKT